MKLTQTLLGLLFATVYAAPEQTPVEPNFFHMMVESAKDTAPRVLESVTNVAKMIPLRKRDSVFFSGMKGKPVERYLPYDIDRRYDEATFRVYDRALKRGHHLPKASING
mgnify:CR=1 FL=1